MSGLKLYEINEMLRSAIEAAEEKIDFETGEIPDDWGVFLDEIQMEHDKKCLSIGALIREKLAEAEAMKAEAQRILKRYNTETNAVKRLKEYLVNNMQVGEKLKDNRVSIGWRESRSVVVTDESKLPEDCFRIVRELSKTEVKKRIESGDEIDGAHIQEKHYIQIR